MSIPPSDPSDAESGDRPAPRSGERVAKLLARAGVASRREVERMIEEGRVKIGDEVVTTANTVLQNLRGVTVDGVPVRSAEATRLFVFHKPSGLITAERDPSGRPTIYTALRNALPPGTPRLMPVGRLDLNTEGLLLLTNDGELKRAMELPASGIPRTYRARTYGEISQAELEELIEGVMIDGMHYGKIDANMERKTGRNQWIELILTEGKNREVRRVLEHLGLEVSRLLRTRYGPFELLDLPRGAAVEVRQVDVERFVKSLKGGAAAQERVNPHSVSAKPISTWVKPAPMPVAAPRAAPAREPEARTYRAGRPFGAQPTAERWSPHAGDEARPKSSPARGGRPSKTVEGARGPTQRRGRPPAPTVSRSAPATSPSRGGFEERNNSRGYNRSSAGRAEAPRSADSEAPKRERNLCGKPYGRPAGKADAKDRGEKLVDRPKAPRAKPAEGKSRTGWAKAKPTGPRKPGPRK